MTQAPPDPTTDHRYTGPEWSRGWCASCHAQRPATVALAGEVRLCATCLLTTAHAQLNQELLARGQASVVPAPGAAIVGGHGAQAALLWCEACVPTPTLWVRWLPQAELWLCPGCLADLASRVRHHPIKVPPVPVDSDGLPDRRVGSQRPPTRSAGSF